jgi:hypothetical protein
MPGAGFVVARGAVAEQGDSPALEGAPAGFPRGRSPLVRGALDRHMADAPSALGAGSWEDGIGVREHRTVGGVVRSLMVTAP